MTARRRPSRRRRAPMFGLPILGWPVVGLLALASVLASAGGCARAGAAPEDLDDALGRLRRAFEEGDGRHLDALLPSDWALVSFSGEAQRSATGAELRRRIAGQFRRRASIAYEERPRSILRSQDGRYVLFVSEWTSMAVGTDHLVVELLRIGLERARPPGSPPEARAGWRIREFTVWSR